MATAPTRHIDWSSNSKHFFILSDAGKPIFSRYGEEDVRLVPLMGVASLLMARTGDKMRCIVAGRYRLVFLCRSPVYLFAVSRTGESVAHLRQQLHHLYAQMLFVVTARGFAVLRKNASYDMRGVLQGIRQPLLSLIHTANSTSSLLLEAVPTIPLLPEVRATANAILRAEKCPELAYAVLLSGFQLVTLVQLKNNPMDPADLLVLMNFVNTNRSLRDNETWLPICLPRLNENGFLNSYISFLGCESSDSNGGGGGGVRDANGGNAATGGGSNMGGSSNHGRGGTAIGGSSMGMWKNSISLMLIATDNALNVFHKFSESKGRIEAKLRERGIVDAIRKSERQAKFTTADIGVPQAFHFIYVHGRSSSVPQYCSTSLSVAPYLDKDSQKRLLRRYVECLGRVFFFQVGCMFLLFKNIQLFFFQPSSSYFSSSSSPTTRTTYG
jgi:vacuolar fusion protein MON1